MIRAAWVGVGALFALEGVRFAEVLEAGRAVEGAAGLGSAAAAIGVGAIGSIASSGSLTGSSKPKDMSSTWCML